MKFQNANNDDIVDVEGEEADRLDELDNWQRVDDGPAVLKGAALTAALEEAGLDTSGTADEKRARLAEHA